MGTKLHSRTATRTEVISTNGIAFLDEILINATITQTEDDFYAEIVLAVKKDESLKYIYDNLIEEAIITLEDEYGDEFFRISNIRKDKRTITIFARQITIADQLTLFLKDCRPENMNGQATLSKLQNDAVGRNKEFFLTSDISDTSTAYYQNMSLYNALFGADNAFIVRWGGEVYRRQYNCKINTRVGQDKGVQIKSRKNLTGFEIKSNVDDLCTRIVPRGFDGIEAPIVESELINNYSSVYTKVMEFSDIKVKNENNPDEGFDTLAQAQQVLQERARTQFTLFNIDKLQATYNINFIELSKTEQYKDYSQAESVEIGDTVEVIEDTYGTKIKARCIKRVYSVTMKKRLSTELSNVKKESRPISVNDIIAELEKELQTKPNANLSDYINSMINAGLKDSYVVLKPNELLIMDNKDINKAVNVTRYNKNGLGFSTTGYYGKYEYGFTIDGKINASLITFGAMSGQYIQAGSITADKLSVDVIQEITNVLGDKFVTKTQFEVSLGQIRGEVTQKIEKLNNNIVINLFNNTIPNSIEGWSSYNGVVSLATSETELKIHIIDTGVQADAILIQEDNINIMVDCGYKGTSNIVIEYLKQQGVKNIDLFIATHAHTDHIGAFEEVANSFSIKKVIYREANWTIVDQIEPTGWGTSASHRKMLEVIKNKNISSREVGKIELFNISQNGRLRIINTTTEVYDEYNTRSLGVIYEHYKNRFLLAGDMTIESEKACLGELGKIDVLKVGHHGANGSNSESYLEEIKPKYGLITTVTIDHIDRKKALGCLQWEGVKMYDTGSNGTFVITSNKETYNVSNLNNEYKLTNQWWYRRSLADGFEEWVYFKANGEIARNETVNIGGGNYEFDENGICKQPY
ncbi:endopeptidase-endolysin [Clostridium phage CPQ4]|nr:endopeptidase-endolysin [Clostridium phage CPQ4]